MLGLQLRRHLRRSCLFVVGFLSSAVAVHGQLHITEVMYDSGAAEPAWEWIELRNAGSDAVDLDGFIFDDISSSSALEDANIVSAISDSQTMNTIVPSGGTSVLYNGRALEFSESRFRSAWNLSNSVSLIAVNGWQALNNGGDAIGLWRDLDSYALDLANTDDDDFLEVAQLSNAVASLDFREGFPDVSAASMEWSGEGEIQSSQNWIGNGDAATLSVATVLEDAAINDARDVGNPGVVIGNPPTVNAGLIITELMFNPASDEPDWEWVELVNASVERIDFAESPHYFDDSDGLLSEPNLNAGVIEPGASAVLFRQGITVEDMQAAWGDEIDFIPVASSWPALNNGGDLIGIWGSEEAYQLDSVDARTTDEAITSVSYQDGADDWPNVGQGNSIYLTDLQNDTNDPFSWALSESGDSASFFAKEVIASQPDHAGGDRGTPGVIAGTEPTTDPLLADVNGDGLVNSADVPLFCAAAQENGFDVATALSDAGLIAGDFNFDGAVNFPDFLLLSASFSQTGHYGNGDSDCDGSVQFPDFLAMSANFGKSNGQQLMAVPEPSGMFIIAALLFVLPTYRVRRMGGDSRRG